jgi:hypothetical protein
VVLFCCRVRREGGLGRHVDGCVRLIRRDLLTSWVGWRNGG